MEDAFTHKCGQPEYYLMFPHLYRRKRDKMSSGVLYDHFGYAQKQTYRKYSTVDETIPNFVSG